MQTNEALLDAFGRIRGLVPRILDGLDATGLAWRPDTQANSIAWLVWHLTRVEDDHVADIVGRDQVWVADGWAERFRLPGDYRDTGYGHSAEQVGAIAPDGAGVLVDYHARVADGTTAFLETADADAFDRIIDPSYDPPVTVGVRLVSVASDSLQHAGQAAYVRGLYQRRS